MDPTLIPLVALAVLTSYIRVLNHPRIPENCNKFNEKNQKNGCWVEYTGLKNARNYRISEGEYSNGVKVGCWQEHAGQQAALSKYECFESGELNGLQLVLRNGKLIKETNWQAGKKSGIEKEYSEEGMLISECFYQNNLKQGFCRKWYGSGNIQEEALWKDGKKDGRCVWFYDSGKPSHIQNYKNDSLHGPFNYYYADGTIETSGTYVHDSLDGLWQSFFPSGKIKETGYYAKGVKIGKRESIEP